MGEIKSLKEIAKDSRKQIKEEFPLYKFSIRTEYYSMGRSLHVCLVKAPFRVFKTEDEIRETFRTHGYGRYDERDVTNLVYDIQRGHTQVNDYYIDESPLYTDEAKLVLKRVKEIVNKDNWDHSDIQTDYFDVHFYLHMSIGTWERPLEVMA